VEIVVIGVIAGSVVATYFLPTIVALNKDHPLKSKVIKINVLLGWSGLFWLVSLFMSLYNREIKERNQRRTDSVIREYEEMISKQREEFERERDLDQQANEEVVAELEHELASARDELVQCREHGEKVRWMSDNIEN
jgi:hypothetical protein